MKTMTSLALIALVAGGASASAQERDAVFIHGLNSGPQTWQDAADRLARELAIRSHRPDLDWSAFFENQAASIDTQMAGVGADVIAIGHSNGGVVAREWSRRRPLGALITLGTPNQGAPFVDHLFEWLAFADDLFPRIANVNAVFTRFVDTDLWWWLPAQWADLFAGVVDVWNVAEHGLAALGVGVNAPVLPEMRQASTYMANLNSPDALNREASAVPQRAAIVSVPKDFAMGGPARFSSDHYVAVHNTLVVAGVGLDYLAWTIRSMADFDDFGAMLLADHLSVVAEWALQFEEVWCRAVSDPSPLYLGRCYEHDGIVPAWSQAYDYPRLPVFMMRDGPVHTRETSGSDGPLFEALRSVAQVPLRSELPAPPTVALPSTLPPKTPPAPAGRYKKQGSACVWDPKDSGPDQCTPPPPPTGRYKKQGSKCIWDPNDSGPNQCSPNEPAPTGRYKISGGSCYWDPNDGGPNQCVP